MRAVAGADDERIGPALGQHGGESVKIGAVDPDRLHVRAATRSELLSQSPDKIDHSPQFASSSLPQVPAPRWPVPITATRRLPPVAMMPVPRWSISRRSGHRFAAGNATNAELEHDPIPDGSCSSMRCKLAVRPRRKLNPQTSGAQAKGGDVMAQTRRSILKAGAAVAGIRRTGRAKLRPIRNPAAHVLVGLARARRAHRQDQPPLPGQEPRRDDHRRDARLVRLLAAARDPDGGPQRARRDPDGLPLHLRVCAPRRPVAARSLRRQGPRSWRFQRGGDRQRQGRPQDLRGQPRPELDRDDVRPGPDRLSSA